MKTDRAERFGRRARAYAKPAGALLALVVAGCTTSHSSRSSSGRTKAREELSVQRVYDSPNGPDLYRVTTPSGTTYHRQNYRSPLRKDMASGDKRP